MDRMNVKGTNRRQVAAGALTLVLSTPLGAFSLASAEEKPAVQLYKNPQCSCCEEYAAYLRQHGYSVTTTPTQDLALIRRQHGVPEQLAGCPHDDHR